MLHVARAPHPRYRQTKRRQSLESLPINPPRQTPESEGFTPCKVSTHHRSACSSASNHCGSLILPHCCLRNKPAQACLSKTPGCAHIFTETFRVRDTLFRSTTNSRTASCTR